MKLTKENKSKETSPKEANLMNTTQKRKTLQGVAVAVLALSALLPVAARADHKDKTHSDNHHTYQNNHHTYQNYNNHNTYTHSGYDQNRRDRDDQNRRDDYDQYRRDRDDQNHRDRDDRYSKHGKKHGGQYNGYYNGQYNGQYNGGSGQNHWNNGQPGRHRGHNAR